MATVHDECLVKMEKDIKFVRQDILRDHIHITFSIAHYNNCSTLLLVVNLLLYLIYKLNRYVHTRKGPPRWR